MVEEVYVARWYHMFLYPDWLRRIHQKPKKFLAPLVKPGMTVADIGCGMGFYTRLLAQMVGDQGRVWAVDLQEQMLSFAKKKAQKAGVLTRINFVQCTQDDIKLTEPVDFALTMWVVHEIPDCLRFFQQLCNVLKPQGQYLMAEPKFHVKKELYKTLCRQAQTAGLEKVVEPKVPSSFAALFRPVP